MKRTKTAYRTKADARHASAALTPKDRAQAIAIAAQLKIAAGAKTGRRNDVLLFAGERSAIAAQALAKELRRDLFHVDLSDVISKYIGETEKNLNSLFDKAGGDAVLLFDEADALFGKRSEVKDSHDRYSNIEVSYLLQRLEGFRGIAIFATSLKRPVSPPLSHRLRVYEFPRRERRPVDQRHVRRNTTSPSSPA